MHSDVEELQLVTIDCTAADVRVEPRPERGAIRAVVDVEDFGRFEVYIQPADALKLALKLGGAVARLRDE